MKLASLKDGSDGRLVVVSNDLAWFADAAHIAPTLQAALADWERIAPDLRGLAESLEHGSVPRERFHEHDAASPLPHAAGGDGFLAPRDPAPLAGADGLEAGMVAVVGATPMGADRDEALAAVRLLMLCNDVSLDGRACAFSPVAVTPDALDGWAVGELPGVLEVELNGRPVGESDRSFDMAGRIVQSARKRPLAAGSLVGAPLGAMLASTLKAGDVVRIEMRDDRRHTVFGAIEHAVAPA